MKTCSKCGMPMKEEDVFCFGCGHKYVEDDTDFSFYGTPQRIIDERKAAEKIERDDNVAFYGEATKRPEVYFEPTGVCCKNCGAELSEGDMFCMNCGAKVELPVKEAPVKVCISCGAALGEEDMFCMNCGTKQVSEEAKQEETAPIATDEEEAVKKCVNCGNKMQQEDIFCMNCGTKQPQEPQKEEAAAEPQPVKSNERICAVCGSKLEEASRGP